MSVDDGQDSMLDSHIRLSIYQHFVDACRAPSLIETATRFGITPDEVEQALRRLQTEADAVVLIPGTRDICMAEPFSAVPTSFLVRSGSRQWWGNCIWDALAILVLVGTGGSVLTACPHSGQPLLVSATKEGLEEAQGIVHFAVPAREWW